jgi:hypothetical protein
MVEGRHDDQRATNHRQRMLHTRGFTPGKNSSAKGNSMPPAPPTSHHAEPAEQQVAKHRAPSGEAYAGQPPLNRKYM